MPKLSKKGIVIGIVIVVAVVVLNVLARLLL